MQRPQQGDTEVAARGSGPPRKIAPRASNAVIPLVTKALDILPDVAKQVLARASILGASLNYLLPHGVEVLQRLRLRGQGLVRRRETLPGRKVLLQHYLGLVHDLRAGDLAAILYFGYLLPR